MQLQRRVSHPVYMTISNFWQALLLRYDALLEAYRRLRSDFEEEREARERYKKLARGQEKNPFVLVLVDLDGYIVS
jgi:hypothetical protein